MVKHSSRIMLSQSALKQNFQFIRQKIGQGPRISSVIKANAYGHGICEFVKMAENCGIDHFSVASAFEAEEVLLHCKKDSCIMIMGILYDEDMEWAIRNGIEFYLFAYNRLPHILKTAKKVGKKAKLHLELETGTNRTGLKLADFDKTIRYLQKHNNHLYFEGLCTHLGGAESLVNYPRIEGQIDLFKKYCAKLEQQGFQPNYRHIACSAAALGYPDTIMDMVRIGIAQYGYWPSGEIYYMHLQDVNMKKDNPLKRVISWKTDVMDTKMVKRDEFIGYGTAFQAFRDMQIAVIPLGYSNGYSKNLSNAGHVLIHGKEAPIVGLINMNLFMVDISHIQNVKAGDEVVLIGKQRGRQITVSSFTNFTNMLNNETISRLPERIPRKIVK